MRIGLVLDDTLDKPDGVQAAVLDIGKELSRRGHEVHYLVTETNRSDLENVHSISGFFSLKFNGNSVRTPRPARKKDIKKLLDRLNLDVIHVQMPYSPLMAGKVVSSVPKKTKVFGTFHILPYDSKTVIGTKILGWYLRRNLKRFDGFFAVSAPANTFMKETFRVSGDVLPNPVNYDFFHSYKKKKSSKTQIVFLGRFDRRKGVTYLLDAYSNLSETVRDRVELTMCGKGPLFDEVKEKSESSNLNIAFPGFVSDEAKAQYLANADIAVFPSTSGESFGIVLAEAMSAGAGVTLGGDNAGYRSVLGDFEQTLFDPKNINEFSEILTTFITDENLRRNIGNKQQDYVKSFDIVKVCDTLLDLYQRSVCK